MMVLAHFGHWWGSLVEFAPVLLFVGWLGFVTARDRRRERREGPGEE